MEKNSIKGDQIVRITPAQAELQVQSHYVTIRTYENAGSDLKKVIDVPYKPAVPQKEEVGLMLQLQT